MVEKRPRADKSNQSEAAKSSARIRMPKQPDVAIVTRFKKISPYSKSGPFAFRDFLRWFTAYRRS